MDEAGLSERVAGEIAALHVEFERWFRGESKDPGRIEASIPEDFTFVSAQGDVIGGKDLLRNIHQGRGTRSIRIRIQNVVVRWWAGDAVVATYEEWHDHADYTTARLSTVLFTHDETAPRGLSWCHVHETWMIPPPSRK